MSTYDNIFFKHFYENFDFNKCTVILNEYNKLSNLLYSEYKIELIRELGTNRYEFYIKDKIADYSSMIFTRNKYADKLINEIVKIEVKIYNNEEEKRVKELNKFLESIHS